MRRIVRFVVCAALVLGSCTSSDDDAEEDDVAQTWDGALGKWRELGLSDWTPCGQAECAELIVPVAETGGPTIGLEIARRRADEQPALGTILMHHGGPGLRGGDLLAQGQGLDPEVQRSFDVVAWNARGTAGDEELTCGGIEDAYARSDHIAGSRAEASRFVECFESAEPLVGNLGLDAQVSDAIAVMDALAIERAHLVGFSWGSWVFQGVASARPERVDRMYLDGVVPLSTGYFHSIELQAAAAEESLRGRLRPCDEAEPCSRTGSTFAMSVLEGTRQGEVKVGRAGSLHPGDLFHAVVASLYSPLATDVNSLLVDADKGNTELVLRAATSYREPLAYGAMILTSCGDMQPSADQPIRPVTALHDDLLESGNLWAAGVVGEYRVCDDLPQEQAFVASPIAAPAIVVSTTDVVTPFDPIAIGESLTAARIVETNRIGHTAYWFSACVRSAATTFIRDGTVPPAKCLDAGGPTE